MNRLHVLHILATTKEEFFINNLISHSEQEEVEFSFVSLTDESSFTTGLRERGHRVYALPVNSRFGYLKASFKLRDIIASASADIVHTHLFGPTLLGVLLAKITRRKVVVTRHHSDAIHQIKNPLKRHVYLGLEKLINRTSDFLIAPSRMVRQFIVDVEGTPSGKVEVIPYGQTVDRYNAVTPDEIDRIRRELGMTEGLSLVCVSRLYERKGHSYLFQALADLQVRGVLAKLFLVGTGDFREQLERLAEKLGIGKQVKFLGWRDDTLAIIAAADIIVHPSLEDALSQSLIESLMLARPIVATDISGARDTLDDGKYGRLVPPADSAGLCEGISEVIDDLAAANVRASFGREYLLEYMDARRVAKAHLQVYQGLV